MACDSSRSRDFLSSEGDGILPPYKKLKLAKCEFRTPKEESDTSPESSVRRADSKEWREDCDCLREINEQALKHKILTDVTFLVGEKAEVFEAHRLILALASPVFEAMFYGALAEKGGSIVIPDVEPEAFYCLLKFVYSESLTFKDDADAFKTAFAADKYCISNLKERCRRYLNRCQLNSSNVWVFLESSLYLNWVSLKQQCLTYLEHNTESCLKHGSFLEANMKAVEEFLNLDTLEVSEDKLLDSVLRWAHSRKNVDDADSFKNLTMPLLHYIRFASLKADEFVYFLEVKNLKDVLKDSDSFLILKHITQPTLCALPSWCCSKLRPSVARPSSVKLLKVCSSKGCNTEFAVRHHKRSKSNSNKVSQSGRVHSYDDDDEESSSSSGSHSSSSSSSPTESSRTDNETDSSSD